MERETRIELATNSLEGCDSTIELLPLRLLLLTVYRARVASLESFRCSAVSDCSIFELMGLVYTCRSTWISALPDTRCREWTG